MCIYIYICIYTYIFPSLSLSLDSHSHSLSLPITLTLTLTLTVTLPLTFSLSLSLSPWLSMFLCFLHVCLQAVILITSDSVANLAPPPRAPLHAPFTSHPLVSHPPIRGKVTCS